MLRREFLAGMAGAAALPGAAGTPLIETHVHIFDPELYPYHKLAPYKAPASTLKDYLKFAKAAGIDHTLIVHPEPYQDDHSHLEYCFANEGTPGFFKGTCLFDPQDPATAKRMTELVKKLPKRIVALRIHEQGKPGESYSCICDGEGPIKDRDLSDPVVRSSWKAAVDLGLAVQMHFLPHHAPSIYKIASEFRSGPVILDHMGRAGMGKPEDFDEVVKLAKLPKAYFKFSGVRYSSKQDVPYADAAPYVRRAFEAFGPERILWGGLGHNMAEHEAAKKVFDHHFAFTTEEQRAMVRGKNAARLFGW